MPGIKAGHTKTQRDERLRENRPLTPQQEKFCQCIAEGMNQSDAYKAAYNCDSETKPSSIHVAGSKLMSNGKIRERVNQINALKVAAIASTAQTDAELVRSKLRHWVNSAEPADSNRIRAAELLGRTVGMFSDVLVTEKKERSASDIERELNDRLAKLTAVPAVEGDHPTIQ